MTETRNIRFMDVLKYLKGTFMLFLLATSLYQTLFCFMKFWKAPVNTYVTFEDVYSHETPGFTICPIPAISFTKVEEYLIRNNAQRRSFLPTLGFTENPLGRFPKLGNISIADFMDEVGLPLWKTLISDCLWSTSEGPFVKSRAKCLFPAAESRESPKVTLDPSAPMTVHTEAGTWTTSLLITDPEAQIILCSKFIPHRTSDGRDGETQKTLHMAFRTYPMDHYRVKDSSRFNILLASGMYDPVYWIFIHEPHESLEMYQVMRPVEPDLVLPLGQRMTVQVNVAEKFRFRNRDGWECLKSADELLQAISCDTWCFESILLNSTCKLPGYTPKAFGFEAEALQDKIMDFNPKICESEEDYDGFFRSFQSDAFSAAGAELKQCKASCVPKRPCTKLRYEAKDSILENAFKSRNYLKNMTELQNFDAPVSTRVTFKIQASQQAKVFIEENAYDGFELTGEIGGAWGLFLGFSILTLLDILERATLELLSKLG